MNVHDSNNRGESVKSRAPAGAFFLFLCVACTAFMAIGAPVGWAQSTQPTSQATVQAAGAGTPASNGQHLKKLSLQDLMDVEVTSVSKRESTVGESPAAVFVITQEDIRRSGATSIAAALRMAPGLEVAQINSSNWAVTARGFNSPGGSSGLSDKLLVLIDGRSVYSPLNAGVFWDVQGTLISDIDRGCWTKPLR